MRGGGSDRPIREGRLTFEHDYAAIAASGLRLFKAGLAAAACAGADLGSVDHVIPHQVSGRIGEQLARHLGADPRLFFVHADRVGNTGSAAIWLALNALRRTGLAAGARVLALGAEATKHMYGGFLYGQR
jgi:3-oxoacyl-[acyl-carrier-protein] synthase-3